jgi:hypothetical protein
MWLPGESGLEDARSLQTSGEAVDGGSWESYSTAVGPGDQHSGTRICPSDDGTEQLV